MTAHRCDNACVCPLDGRPLLYWPVGGQHACQDPECANAQGVVEPDIVSALTARIREAQKGVPQTSTEAAVALDDALQPDIAGLVVCYTRCWGCQFGQCYDPRTAHPWADVDDIEHAKATGRPEPTGNCACPCAREQP